jgi:cytochrome b involved in lipid metabolism
MTFIGLSLLLATFTYYFYKNPPSWPLQWLTSLSQKFGASDNVVLLRANDGAVQACSDRKEYSEHSRSFTKDGSGATAENERGADIDQKAMPPPALFKKPTDPGSSAASSEATAGTTPGFSLSSDSDPTIPCFPALNSAQRTSQGRASPRLNVVPTIQAPLRSVSLMSPPMRGPGPDRGRPSSSLTLPPSHISIPTKPSKKVELTPGHSPLDWARLSDSPDVNLCGLPPSSPYLKVPPSRLRQHTGRKGKDAWTVLGGKVYNITPYLPYHPGGEPELMKCAGRDGTKLFAEVHPWVNWEGMLSACLVGVAVGEKELAPSIQLDGID